MRLFASAANILVTVLLACSVAGGGIAVPRLFSGSLPLTPDSTSDPWGTWVAHSLPADANHGALLTEERADGFESFDPQAPSFIFSIVSERPCRGRLDRCRGDLLAFSLQDFHIRLQV